jgi:hypothetical protein
MPFHSSYNNKFRENKSGRSERRWLTAPEENNEGKQAWCLAIYNGQKIAFV